MGDVVLLKDELLKPVEWAMEVVVQSYPGNDGITRVVDIYMSKVGVIKRRPIVKLLVPNPEQKSE